MQQRFPDISHAILLVHIAGRPQQDAGRELLLGELASTNPLAFYSGADLACRRQLGDGLSPTLAVVAHLPRFSNGPLLVSSLHVKALTSAMASWVKAYINWLPSAGDLSAAVGGVECPSGATHQGAVLLHMELCLALVWSATAGCQGDCVGDKTPGQVEGKNDRWASVHSSIHLVLLLLLSKAVSATGRLLLLVLDGPSSSTGSRNSRRGSSRDGDGEVVTPAAAVAAAATPSSRSSGDCAVLQLSSSSRSRTSERSSSRSSSIADDCNAGEGRGTCSSGGDSSTSGTKAPSTVTSTSSCSSADTISGRDMTTANSSSSGSGGNAIGGGTMKNSNSPGDSCYSSRCGDGVSVQATTGTLLVRVVEVALELHKGLLQWQIRALGKTPQPAPASVVSDNVTAATPAAAAAGGAGVYSYSEAATPAAAAERAEVSNNGEAAAPAAAAGAGGAGVSSYSGTDAPAAAAGVNLSDQLPQRFSRLPHQGLPEAVLKLLQSLGNSIRQVMHDVEKDVCVVRQVQQQVLRDVVALFEVLQQEVPCPVGCNNPHCVNLKGISEIATSCKTCTGCGVARYCSRECQVGHWKVHKGTCRRLQKESPG